MKPTDQQLLEHFAVYGVSAHPILSAGGIEAFWESCNDGVQLLTLAINLRVLTTAQRRDLACWAIRQLPYDESGCMTFADTIEGSHPHDVLAAAEAHAQGVSSDAELAAAAKGLGTYIFKSRDGDYDRAQIAYAVSCAASPDLANAVSDRTAICALFIVKQSVPERSSLVAKELRKRVPLTKLRQHLDQVRRSVKWSAPKPAFAGEELL